MIDYVKISIIAGICAIAFGSGWWMGYSRYIEYKKQVEIAAKAQEAHVESIKKQQELTTNLIQKEYDAKLALLRQYYANGMHQSNPSSVSPNSGIAPKPIDVSSAYSILVGQCAETTQQLVSLQEWLNEQMGLK